MSIRNAVAFLLGAALAVMVAAAHAAPPDGTPTPLKEYTSDDEKFAISLPESWDVRSAPLEQGVMAWTATLPDGQGDLLLRVYHLPGMTCARAQPYMERDIHPKNLGVPGPAKVEIEPIPELWLDLPNWGGRPARRVWMFRVVRRNGFTVAWTCAPDLWPAVKDDCVRVARSLTAKADPWPADPPGCKQSMHEGIEYFVAKGVKDADVDFLQKLIHGQRAAFEKLHGPLPTTPDCPLQVVVCARPGDAAPLNADAGKARGGNWTDMQQGRLFLVPPARGDFQTCADAVTSTWIAFHALTYGSSIVPQWFCHGESVVAGAELMAGKPLPAIPQGYAVKLPGPLLPSFDEVASIKLVTDANLMATYSYVAFFRLGPKRYQDAYRAFLDEAGATGDFETAQKEHLLSLDQDDLRKAAITWLSKTLQPVKGK